MTNKTITLTWTPATQRADGAALTTAEISAVKVYTDQGSGGAFFLQATIPVANGNQCVISNNPPGTYKFKLATVDSNSQEGAMSAVITAVVPSLPALPNPPGNGAAALS